MDDLLELLLQAAPHLEIQVAGDQDHVRFEFGKTELELRCRVRNSVERVDVGMNCLVAWVGHCGKCHMLDTAPTSPVGKGCRLKHLEIIGNLRSVLGHDRFERFKNVAIGRAASLPMPCQM